MGLKKETQGPSELVPGGFKVWVGWEKIPGLHIGAPAFEQDAPNQFWALNPDEQQAIRGALVKAFP